MTTKITIVADDDDRAKKLYDLLKHIKIYDDEKLFVDVMNEKEEDTGFGGFQWELKKAVGDTTIKMEMIE